MISPRYCLTMARYNAWQNRQLKAAFEALAPEDLTRDRGAFFGSILATANHLLWADRIWLARFTGGRAPDGRIAESVGLCVTHMFNHQTHHRGQIHAMLTQAGAAAPVSDLFILPDEGPWL